MLTKEQYLKFKQNHPLDRIAASQAREYAFEQFLNLGLPTKNDEAWKYTSLSYLKNLTFEIATDDLMLSHEDMKWLADRLDANYLNIVFTNGIFNRTLSDDVDFLFSTVEMLTADFKEIITTESKMAFLSKAFSSKKSFIKINKKNQTDRIIHVTFFQSSTKPIFANPTTEIIISEGATAKIIFKYESRINDGHLANNQGHLVNSEAHIKLEKKASLQFLQIQDEAISDSHVSRLKFDLDERSQLITLDLGLGAGLARHYLEVNFNSENASAGVYGVVALSKTQHTDNYTFINHKKGHNQSVQKYKSILNDQSTSIFRGRIRIEKNSQKAQSEQLNHNLLLSREATSNSIPQLEIYADDVKAGHGTTVGQLNKDEIFYFLSRGIDQITATRLLAFGFVLEMVSVFEDVEMKNLVSKTLNNKLNGMLI